MEEKIPRITKVRSNPENADRPSHPSNTNRFHSTPETNSSAYNPLNEPLCSDTIHFNKICNYLHDIPKEGLDAVGTSLGLNYCQLRNLRAEVLPHEMVAWWLQRKHRVQEVSGTPTLNTLIAALEEKGWRGHASKIKNDNRLHERVMIDILNLPANNNSAQEQVQRQDIQPEQVKRESESTAISRELQSQVQPSLPDSHDRLHLEFPTASHHEKQSIECTDTTYPETVPDTNTIPVSPMVQEVSEGNAGISESLSIAVNSQQVYLSSMTQSVDHLKLHRSISRNIQTEVFQLMDQFNQITSHTFEKISKGRLKLEQIKKRVFSRKIEFKGEHEEYFQQFHARLQKCLTTKDLWDNLCGIWNFLNPTLLVSLIRRFRYRDLMDKVDQYLESFQIFKCNTRVSDFAEFYSPRYLSNGLDFTTEFDLNWEVCTLESIHDAQECIRCVCQIPSCCTVLQEISQGSLIVTWSVPTDIALHAKSKLGNIDLNHFSKKLSILSIEINDDEVICSDGIGCFIQKEARRLESHLASIADKTYDRIDESNMTVGQFKARLHNLPIEYRNEHKEFFQRKDEEIDKLGNLDEIWSKLSKYWSFLNYTLLESLIDRLGYNDLTAEIDAFVSALEEFQKNTLACDFARYYTPLQEKNVDDDLEKLVVRFHMNWRICYLADVVTLQGNIMRRFHLPSFVAELKKILSGSLIVSWLLPKEIARLIKEHLKSSDMDEFYADNGIISFSIGGEEFIHKKAEKFDGQESGAACHIMLASELSEVKLANATSENPIQGDVSALSNTFEQLQSSTSDMIAKQFTLSSFKDGLNKLDMKWKDSFFSDIFFETESEKLTLSKVWKRLNVHWSFLNVTLLEHIINEFEDEALQLSFEDYVEELMEFQCRAHLNDYIECSTPTYTTLREEKFTELTVQLNRCHMEYKLDDLDEVTEFVANKFAVPKFFLILKDIEISGITITWAVPSIVKGYLREVIDKTDLSLFCRRHKITSITVASEAYNYSVANIAMEVSKWCRDIDIPLPTTMTQLYSAYTCELMSHISKTQGKNHTIRSLNEMPGDMHSHFLKLCQIAWEGIVEKKIVISSSMVIEDTLGLIEEVRRESNLFTYHFTHQAVQEFLAAYHIAQLPLKMQEDVIQKNLANKEMKDVIKFYFGLAKHHEFTSKLISEHLESDIISADQWYREASAGLLQPPYPHLHLPPATPFPLPHAIPTPLHQTDHKKSSHLISVADSSPSLPIPPAIPFPLPYTIPTPLHQTDHKESTRLIPMVAATAEADPLVSSGEEMELEPVSAEVASISDMLKLLNLTPPSKVKVPGQENLFFLLNRSSYECSNCDDDHNLCHALVTASDEQFLESCTDEQLILSVSFKEPVKLHSLQITSPLDGRAPKNIKIFINQPRILDFSEADQNKPIQELCLTENDVTEKATIPLHFCSYQSVHNIVLFVRNNQGDKETTVINHLAFFGMPKKEILDMTHFQRVAGQEGEKHKHAWDPCIDRNR